jgi:hypothetical protein
MGEIQNWLFQVSFNSSLKIDSQGSRINSDAGLLVVRELDDRLGLSQLISGNLIDARRGQNTQLPLSDLLRQSSFSRLAVMKISTMPSAFPTTRPSGCLARRRSAIAVRPCRRGCTVPKLRC